MRNEKYRLVRAFLPTILLEEIEKQPIHGYALMQKIRKTMQVYFGPSTLYPALMELEKEKLISSEWNMLYAKPRRIYIITEKGKAKKTSDLVILASIPIFHKA
jgi:DNA-binding PadR family transcriptional regulator